MVAEADQAGGCLRSGSAATHDRKTPPRILRRRAARARSWCNMTIVQFNRDRMRIDGWRIYWVGEEDGRASNCAPHVFRSDRPEACTEME
jgi:hypothetical protein